jgi:hypothetical protein
MASRFRLGCLAVLGLLSGIGLAASAQAQCTQNYVITGGTQPFIAGATDDTGNHCDDCSSVVTFPFPVSFYGTMYNSGNVGSNGWIDFTTPHATGFYTNVALPTTAANGAFGPAILAFWDDGYTSGTANGQGIFTQTVGSAPNRKFVIEWREGYCCTAAAPVNNYEVIFTEGSNDFDVVYGVMADRGSATVGAQDTTPAPAGRWVQYTANTAGVITSNLSLHFNCGIPPAAGACCSPTGACNIAATASACTSIGNFFFGVSTACSATTCPTGACCTSGVCSLKISNACTGAGNTFTAGAACTGTYASPVQAAHAIEDISISSASPGTAFALTGGTLDDGYNTNIPIGFTFNFFGTAQTTINIATNGVLYFGATAYTGYPAPAALPAVTTPTNSIAVYWADMFIPTADTITYSTNGVAPFRRFIVQWNNAPRYNLGAATGSVTAEAILYETADAVEIRYGNVDPGAPSGTNLVVGVEDSTGTVATSFDANTIGTGNLSVFFAAGANPCAGGAPTGSCCLNGCQVISYAACLSGGGAFNGNGTTCTSAPCSSGACCALAGGCTAQVGPICTGAGGVFQGIGTTCGATPCPAGGRCCSGITCTTGFQANCTGTFTANASCTPNNCAGSCCDANGVCTLTTNAGSCVGAFAGAGTTCATNPCPAPPNDECANAIPIVVGAAPVTGTTLNSTQSYNPLPGWCAASQLDVFWSFTVPAPGNYGISMTSTIATSVIVIANCGDTTAIACSGTIANNAIALFSLPAAGTYFIRNAAFTGNNAQGAFSIEVHTVTAGACCNDATGACTTVTTATCAAGATYQGDNTACSATLCGQGACCNPASGVCTLATLSGCTGQFQSVATTCTPTNPCPQPPTGACCNSTTGACTQVFAVNCSATTSTYSGDNSTCNISGFCAGVGTCCSSLGSCFVRYSGNCPAGVTDNAALTCSPTLCPASGARTCENFDSGAAGTRPANWTSVVAGAGADWVIDSTQSNSPSNAIFTNDVATASTQTLQLPAVTAGGSLTLEFLSYFDTETNWDGWVVEYSTDSGGSWTDIGVGGTWVLNGYNNAALNVSANSLTGRPAFSGVFTAWTLHSATIPSNNGDSVIFRFVMGSDASVAHVGVWLDDICIGGIQSAAGGVCCRGSTCSTSFATATACAAAVNSTSATVLSKFVPALAACNTPVTIPGTLGNTTSPCCYANYNHNASIEVQDIFDFINDWLAGKKAAIVGGNGTTGTLDVQNIFDFINAWLAGGCS